MSARGRTGVLVAVAALTVFGGACGRLTRGRAPAPAPRPDTAARTAADTGRRADTTAADTARPVAVPVGSARRDTAGRAAAPRRREPDPTARCGGVAFNQEPADPQTARINSITDATGKFITFVGGGVVARCARVNNTLRADSAEYYETAGYLVLIGNVAYSEPRRVSMTSYRLTYFLSEERLLAEGNVFVTMPTGTTMNGPNAEYLRAVAPIRTRSRLTAVGRPTLRVVERGGARAAAPRTGEPAPAAAPRADTATIIANTIVDDGDSLVYASGAVQIFRSNVTAASDSATFDQGSEIARLMRNATINGTEGRKFTLSGALIDLFSRERELTRVVSRGEARIVSADLNLTSDTVDLRLDSGRVERAFAWGPSRATAVSTDRDIVADSIDVLLPGQRIRELRALRRAVARSLPDSTRIASKERDVLSGDTIRARFDTLASPADTSRNPPVRQIVAAGNASSVYQLASSQGRAAPPAINYVRGREITVDFDSSEVQTVTVVDGATGVYLEPVADSARDTTARRARRGTPSASPGGRSGAAARGQSRPPARTPARRPTASAPAPARSRTGRTETTEVALGRAGDSPARRDRRPTSRTGSPG